SDRLLIVIGYNCWFDKFVCYTMLIGMLHRSNWIIRFFTNSRNEGIISQFYSFPSLVAVHREITATNTCYFSNGSINMLLQLRDETKSTFRICVAAIRKGMNKYILESFLFTEVQDRLQ